MERQKKKSKCLWLVYSSYHPLNFTFSHLTVWTARPALYSCGTTPIRLFWIPFEIPTKSSYQKVYRYLDFPKFPIPKEIPWWKSSKQERNAFIISVTSTLPSQSNPRLGPGLGSNIIVCVVLFLSYFEKIADMSVVWAYVSLWLCNLVSL